MVPPFACATNRYRKSKHRGRLIGQRPQRPAVEIQDRIDIGKRPGIWQHRSAAAGSNKIRCLVHRQYTAVQIPNVLPEIGVVVILAAPVAGAARVQRSVDERHVTAVLIHRAGRIEKQFPWRAAKDRQCCAGVHVKAANWYGRRKRRRSGLLKPTRRSPLRSKRVSYRCGTTARGDKRSTVQRDNASAVAVAQRNRAIHLHRAAIFHKVRYRILACIQREIVHQQRRVCIRGQRSLRHLADWRRWLVWRG